MHMQFVRGLQITTLPGQNFLRAVQPVRAMVTTVTHDCACTAAHNSYSDAWCVQFNITATQANQQRGPSAAVFTGG